MQNLRRGHSALADEPPRYVFVHMPAGWVGDFHAAPTRQLFVGLAGVYEVEVSSGELRHFGAGSTVLLEDTSGIGHITRIVGDEDGRGIMVQLD